MRDALQILFEREPDLEVEGEMHSDAAISEEIRERIFPNSRLTGSANLLIMPDLDAANIAFNLLKALGDAVNVGPILAGVAKPAHVLTQSITVRGIVNMSAIAVVDAQEYAVARDAAACHIALGKIDKRPLHGAFCLSCRGASPSRRLLCDISAAIRQRERRPTIGDRQRH
jgi:hypothetical protein